jgi:hypothetical protein
MTVTENIVFELLTRVYAIGNSYFDDKGNHCHHIPTTFTEAERHQLINAGLQP